MEKYESIKPLNIRKLYLKVDAMLHKPGPLSESTRKRVDRLLAEIAVKQRAYFARQDKQLSARLKRLIR